jgi:tetratricopeptide (TPR) repeat protein
MTRASGLGWVLFAFAALPACGPTRPPAIDVAPAITAQEAVHAPELAAGVQALAAGEYESARVSFAAAARSNPRDDVALWDLGQACEKLGDGVAAANAYRAELALKPDADRAAAALAGLYAAEGHIDDALAIAARGLASHPSSAPLHAAMGNALAIRGDQDAAIAQLVQALEIEPTNAMLHYTLATWLNRWQVRGAGPHLDAAAALIHDDYPMTVSIGHEYRLAGDFAACVRTLDAAVKTRDRGEPRTERALCKLGLHDDAGALADLQAAVATEPTYAQGHFFLAGRLAGTKKFKEAAAEYKAYLELAPDGSLGDQAKERLKLAEDAAALTVAGVAPPAPKGSRAAHAVRAATTR